MDAVYLPYIIQYRSTTGVGDWSDTAAFGNEGAAERYLDRIKELNNWPWEFRLHHRAATPSVATLAEKDAEIARLRNKISKIRREIIHALIGINVDELS